MAIFKQETYVDDAGRVVQEQRALPPFDAVPTDKLCGYVGTGQITFGPQVVTLQYRIEATSIEEEFERTDAAFQAAAAEWQKQQLAAHKKIVTAGDAGFGKVLRRGGLNGGQR